MHPARSSTIGASGGRNGLSISAGFAVGAGVPSRCEIRAQRDAAGRRISGVLVRPGRVRRAKLARRQTRRRTPTRPSSLRTRDDGRTRATYSLHLKRRPGAKAKAEAKAEAEATTTAAEATMTAVKATMTAKVDSRTP